MSQITGTTPQLSIQDQITVESNVFPPIKDQIAKARMTKPAQSPYAARIEGFNTAQKKGAQTIPRSTIEQMKTQLKNESFLTKVGRWFKEGSLRAKGDAGLPKEIEINHPKLGKVTYKAQELKSFINTLPRLERAAARLDLQKHLEDRINKGVEAYKNAISGDPNVPRPSVQEVSDLMLFLDAKAHATGNGFQEGAFSIEDNGSKIYDYLDRCDDKYLRPSEHMQGSQKDMVQGHMNIHRGIDIPPGPNGLPNNKGAILFAAIKGHGDVAPRIYLKPETAGCRLSNLSQHDYDEGRGLSVQRKLRYSDVGQAIVSAFANLGSTTPTKNVNSSDDNIPSFNREGYEALMADGVRNETIPSKITHDYEEIIYMIKNYPIDRKDSTKQALIDILNSNNPTGNDAGVHTMINNIKKAREFLNNDSNMKDASSNRFKDTFKDYTNFFASAIAENLKNTNNLESRIGDEVMFSAEQLQAENPEDSSEPKNLNAASITVANYIFDK